MIEQDSSSYSKEDQSKFVDKWENNIEKIERNRKIMREGAEAVEIYKSLGLLATEGYNIRKVDRIP
jgi:sensor domain CHASE-containing protein